MYRMLLVALCLLLPFPSYSGAPDPLLCNLEGIPNRDRCLQRYRQTGQEKVELFSGRLWAKTDLIDDSWVLGAIFNSIPVKRDPYSEPVQLYFFCTSSKPLRIRLFDRSAKQAEDLIYRFGYEVAQSGQWKPDHRVGWAYDLHEYAQKSFLDDLAIYDRLVIRRVDRLGSGSDSKMRSDHVWEFNPVNKAFMVNVMKSNCIER